jgi:hypothetical protein
MKCVTCGEQIEGGVGYSDIVNGEARTSHKACYVLRDLLYEALPWCPSSVKDRIMQRAKREGVEV